MFKKLRTVIYNVPNLQKAKEWYTKLMGFPPYFDETFYVGFDINGCELGLHPRDETVIPGNQTVSYWAVDGIEDCVRKLVAENATILQDTADVGGGIKVATLIDPWGNALGLIEGA
ncbi:MAG TPA: VOC family protein [Ferruginibacter sp.]|jgi:predicted enzyme related to lactoylglutathione lyase|nr:VOC family protein [Ferruginibacter sp.]